MTPSFQPLRGHESTKTPIGNESVVTMIETNGQSEHNDGGTRGSCHDQNHLKLGTEKGHGRNDQNYLKLKEG